MGINTKHVYQLQATGVCGLTDSRLRVVLSSMVFTTAEKAAQLIDKFRQTTIGSMKLDGEYPIEVKVIELEIVE